MPIDILKAEGRSLEEEFFARVNQELKQKLREQESRAESIRELSRVSGIQNETFLETLLGSNITASTLQALSMIPLVKVAWADGKLDVKERDAIVRAAEEQGMDATHPGFEALKGWLETPPSEKLFDSWKHYVRELGGSMDRDSFQQIRKEILGRTRKVAQAAGGFLGLAVAVSAAEKAEMKKIEDAFDLH